MRNCPSVSDDAECKWPTSAISDKPRDLCNTEADEKIDGALLMVFSSRSKKQVPDARRWFSCAAPVPIAKSTSPMYKALKTNKGLMNAYACLPRKKGQKAN